MLDGGGFLSSTTCLALFLHNTFQSLQYKTSHPSPHHNRRKVRWFINPSVQAVFCRGHYYISNPNNALFIAGEIPQNYPTFAFFDPSQMGNLMTSVFISRFPWQDHHRIACNTREGSADSSWHRLPKQKRHTPSSNVATSSLRPSVAIWEMGCYLEVEIPKKTLHFH